MSTQDSPAPSQNPLPISVFLIARNEEARIAPVLDQALSLSEDIIVIDSGSTDKTQAIAKQKGCRVVEKPWMGYGKQKRFGEEQCKNAWMLNLDADEWMSPELCGEIRDLFKQGEPPCDAYELRFAEVLPGESVPHKWGYVYRYIRLYKKGAGRFSTSPAHDTVSLVAGVQTGRLKGLVHHRSVITLGQQLHKLNRYTDTLVDDLAHKGRRLSRVRIFTELPLNFLKCYLLRRHFLRGSYGLLTALNYAYFRHLRVAKHFERRRLEKTGLKPTHHTNNSGGGIKHL